MASQGKTVIPSPRLERRDAGEPRKIELQFPPENGVSFTAAGDWAEGTALGRGQPISQFLSGKLLTYNFEARFFARHSAEDVKPQVDRLCRATVADAKLRRPPLWDLIWGSVISATVVIESAAVTFRAVREDGSLQDATVAVTLRLYTKVEIQRTDPDEREHNTFFVRAQRGDTYESIARRRFGDPMIGELLRREDPAHPFIEPNQLVMVLDEEKVRGVVVNPLAIPLARNQAAIDMRRDLFALRGARTKFSTILKR